MSYPHILCWLQATVVEYTWCFGRMKYVLWQIFCGSNEMTLRVLVLAEFLWQQWYDVGRFVSCWINEFCFYLASVWSHRNTKTRSFHVFQRRCCCCCLPRARIVALSCYPRARGQSDPFLSLPPRTSRTFLANEYCFSLTTNQSTVLFSQLISQTNRTIVTIQKVTLQRYWVQDLLRNFGHRWDDWLLVRSKILDIP